jgi:hypothetical protein
MISIGKRAVGMAMAVRKQGAAQPSYAGAHIKLYGRRGKWLALVLGRKQFGGRY